MKLPWEVIERVIDLSCDDFRTLHSFSLTCRQLRPRSYCLMFARGQVVLWSRDSIFDFLDFLQDNRLYLIPFVRSIVTYPPDFAPFPLLRVLSNLSYIKFTSGFLQTSCVLHQSTLTCLRCFGSHIQTLHLFEIRFATFRQFAVVLLAFTNVEHLICESVTVDVKKDEVPPAAIKRRVSERVRLKTMAIDSLTLEGPDDMQSAAMLLFDSDLGPSTVESLRLIDEPASLDTPLFRSDWSQLRSLVLQSPVRYRDTYGDACELLENFPKGPKLAEVAVERTHLSSIADLPRDLLNHHRVTKLYRRLERALLRFSQPRIVWIIDKPTTASLKLFWTQELSKHFPLFSLRGTLAVSGETRVTAVLGHEARINAFAVSPNSKWVATGSNEASDIILWNTDGNIAQRWVANGFAGVQLLAFSPNSRHLLSVGKNQTAEIWDLGCEPATICATLHDVDIDAPCLWSPDGSVVAAVSQVETVRLWDARTFRELACPRFETYTRTVHLTFSPDGRWLAFRLRTPQYCILDVALAKPHGFMPASSRFDDWHAFHSGSTRLATRSESGLIIIRDVETGERLFAFGDGSFKRASSISFSPDGTRVLAVLEKRVHIWDVSTGAELVQLTGHAKWVGQVCFSPCGRYVASASGDRTVRLWRADNGACVATFSEHESSVGYLAFSPSGETLSSAARNGTVCVRRMRDIIPVDGQLP